MVVLSKVTRSVVTIARMMTETKIGKGQRGMGNYLTCALEYNRMNHNEDLNEPCNFIGQNYRFAFCETLRVRGDNY